MELSPGSAVRQLTAISKHCDGRYDRCSKYESLVEFITSDFDGIYMAQEYTLRKVKKSSSETFVPNNLQGVISQKNETFVVSL